MPRNRGIHLHSRGDFSRVWRSTVRLGCDPTSCTLRAPYSQLSVIAASSSVGPWGKGGVAARSWTRGRGHDVCTSMHRPLDSKSTPTVRTKRGRQVRTRIGSQQLVTVRRYEFPFPTTRPQHLPPPLSASRFRPIAARHFGRRPMRGLGDANHWTENVTRGLGGSCFRRCAWSGASEGREEGIGNLFAWKSFWVSEFIVCFVRD